LPKIVGITPPASGRNSLAMLRAALVAGVGSALLVALVGSADAAPRWSPYFGSPAPAAAVKKPNREAAAVKKPNPEKEGFVDVPRGVLQINVSLANQRVTLYSNGVRVAQAPVSTGTASHPTPMGVFSIIEKDRFHRSNLYHNAPMFFMQRLTWSGVAMHEGVLPGVPASHGCIRLPREFAARLWPTTRLGARVIVSRNEVAPVDFQHPNLFVPKPKPDAQVAMNGPTDGLNTARPVRVAEATTTTTDAGRSATEAAPEVPNAATDAAPAESKVEEGKVEERAAGSVEKVEKADAAQPAEEVKAAESTQPAESTTRDETATGTVAPALPADAPVPLAPGDLRKSVEAPQPVAPALPAEAAPSGSDSVKPAPALVDPPKPPAPPKIRAADQPAKRTGQVAVFVSRKEKKIFVRQGFIPLFDMPITIERPDQPLGTHVFTAIAFTDNGAGMRWNLITVPTDPNAPEPSSRRKSREPLKPVVQVKPAVHLKPSSAAEALNRIQMPKEAVDRIGELLIPGSSLVVSDEGLGRETGRYTEFIVVTR
jgi:lipoprotein-anchoring transpeptidase ErfK/SrfK